MKKIIDFFRLIRIPNLLIVILTQYLLRKCVILPIFQIYEVTPVLNDFLFYLLVLSTVLISAAGYIINDYFDIKIDLINKPDKTVIGKSISRNFAMGLHILFNIGGVATGFYVAWKIAHFQLGYIQLISAGLLWFYSTTYKKQFIIGNLIVSLLSGMVISIVGFFEPILYKALSVSTQEASGKILYILLAYTFFAFMLSLIREIVKDMEDARGDADYNCKTIPIILGIKKSKIIIVLLTLLVISALVYIQMNQFAKGAIHPLLYIIFFIQIPLLYLLWQLKKSEEQHDFHQISGTIKGIMLMGILSMAYFYHFSLKI